MSKVSLRALRISMAVSLVLSLSGFAAKTSYESEPRSLYLWQSYYWASWKLQFFDPATATQEWVNSWGQKRKVLSSSIYNNPSSAKVVNKLENQIKQNALYSVYLYFLTLIFGVTGTYLYTRKRTYIPDQPHTHGSSQLASVKEIKAVNQDQGFIIGGLPKRGDIKNPIKLAESIKDQGGSELIRVKADHAMVIAPTGAGKGVGCVIPLLLDYKGAVVVTDIKGELYGVTSRYRKSMGRKVLAIDPFGITDAENATFNPLDFLDPGNESIVEDSELLSSLICPIPPHEAGNTKYFAGRASAVIQCLILYVVCFDGISKNDKNLGTVYRYLCASAKELEELLFEVALDREMAFGTVSRLANRILATDPRELSGTLNSAVEELRFIDVPPIRRSLSEASFNLRDLIKGDIDLFLCIPSEKVEQQNRFMRLVVGILFAEVQKARGQKPKLLMVLDEMPSLGYLPQLENIMAFGRGYGISIFGLAQTIEQLQAIYPKKWNLFLSTPLTMFFGSTDNQTCRYVSERLGKSTIETQSQNTSEGSSRKSLELLGSHSTQESQSQAKGGRDLLDPSEVGRLGDKVMLAFLRGAKPIMCERISYFKRKEFKGTYEENSLFE